VEAEGSDSLDLLHRISTNALLDLSPGNVRQTIFTDHKGRLVDVVTVAVRNDRLTLLCSREQEQKLIAWLDKYVISEDVSLRVITSDTAVASIIGPETFSVASALFEHPIRPDVVTEFEFEGVPLTAVGTESVRGKQATVIFSTALEERFWDGVSGRLDQVGIPRITAEAWELYRTSKGIPSVGTEIVESYNPYDVDLVDLVSYTKGCYIGQEVIARLDTYQKVRKGLLGIRCVRRPLDLQLPYRLFREDVHLGSCTSLTKATFGGEHLGLGILPKDSVEVEDSLTLGDPGSAYSCRVSALPMEFDFS
jgi:folate-binding protein YgfZ